jgi:BirA family biotin operon repressor/biotin-[acetyl-CoA-carboxylase] ligase
VIRGSRPLLSLIAGIAVAEAIGADARLKWPNDVLVDGRKVAGILVEGRPQEGWVVLGVGVNVAVRTEDLPPELHARAGTLGLAPTEIEPTLARLLQSLTGWLERPDDEILAAFADRDALLGQTVTWSEGRGRACGVDDRGRLVVRTADGRQEALCAGEVHLAGE